MDAHPTSLLIDRALIYSSLYDLAAVVFGSEGIAQQSTGDDRDEFDKLRIRHEIGQATKLLIEVAVVLRNLLDGEQWPLDVIHELRVERRPERDVGTLETASKETTLSFREACNKLIHAKRVSFGIRELSGKTGCLDGTAKLHGTKAGHDWVARIELSEFIRMAVRQL